MRLRKSIFLKVFIFLFSTICIYYACFVVISNLTAGNNLFQRADYGDSKVIPNYPFEDSSGPGFQSPEFTLPAESEDSNSFQYDMADEYVDEELSNSEIDNLLFANSIAGNIVWVLVALLIVLSGFIYHSISIGWHKGSDQMHFSITSKWPVDLLLLLLLLFLAIFISIGFIFSELLSQANLATFPRIQIYLSTIATSCFVAIYSYSLLIVGQAKAGTLVKSSFIYLIIKTIVNLIKRFFSLIKKIYHLIPLMWREIIVLIVFIIGDSLLISIRIANPSFFIIVLLILYNLAFLIICVTFINNFRKIKNAILALSRGQLDYQLNEQKMSHDFQELTHAINNLNEGINLAIEEKTKSELFKTELITNVSHDIKTPLTSIIAYTDLLQREEINNKQAEEYVEVLSRQAARLKNLIEDLIEASKISTGNINVQLIPLDLKQLLEQAYAEYEERLINNKLKLIITFPEEACIVWADGKYFWRVLDNLLSNVVKYAQPDTRVYLDVLCKNSDHIRIILRNVSAEPLNISADQLFERFVQGDFSRSQGGSGIGLSIAKSLIIAQHGTMEIQIDGDLFTVDLKLPRYIAQYQNQ